jgi:hypothetical protein
VQLSQELPQAVVVALIDYYLLVEKLLAKTCIRSTTSNYSKN